MFWGVLFTIPKRIGSVTVIFLTKMFIKSLNLSLSCCYMGAVPSVGAWEHHMWFPQMFQLFLELSGGMPTIKHAGCEKHAMLCRWSTHTDWPLCTSRHCGYHAQSCFLRDLPIPCCLYKHKQSKTIGCFQFYNGESCQSQMVFQFSVRLEVGFVLIAFFFEIFHCWMVWDCWEKSCGFIKHGRAAPKHV